MLDQQYQLCCYSEIRGDEENIGYHIEHIRPKSTYPEQTFDYYNLTASAIRSNDLSQLDDRFGGHAKLSDYDEEQFISCLHADCSHYFRYLSDGRIVPSSALEPNSGDKEKAVYTIELLNLNSHLLINRRRKWWNELELLMQEHIDEDMSLYHLAAVDLTPRGDQLSPFFSLTRQFFARIAEEVLKENAPELL